MYKRQLDALAKGLKEKVWDRGQRLQAANVIAEVAIADNPRFDSLKFFDACGLVALSELNNKVEAA